MNTHPFKGTLLRNAYKKPDDWTVVSHDKMAVAGSQTATDWYADFTKIHVYGDLRNSDRYNEVTTAAERNPQVNSLIGHSLSGSVILEKQKQNPGKFDNVI